MRISKKSKTNGQSGFSLLELMIVMFVIVILASVALPQYQRTIQYSRETVLRDDLHQMRRMIDQYTADKGKMPKSLQDLVQAGYMREIPVDPMTESADWEEIQGEDYNSKKGEQGLKDIRSKSTEESLDGKTYSQF